MPGIRHRVCGCPQHFSLSGDCCASRQSTQTNLPYFTNVFTTSQPHRKSASASAAPKFYTSCVPTALCRHDRSFSRSDANLNRRPCLPARAHHMDVCSMQNPAAKSVRQAEKTLQLASKASQSGPTASSGVACSWWRCRRWCRCAGIW